jgi:hypothetical protein
MDGVLRTWNAKSALGLGHHRGDCSLYYSNIRSWMVRNPVKNRFEYAISAKSILEGTEKCLLKCYFMHAKFDII